MNETGHLWWYYCCGSWDVGDLTGLVPVMAYKLDDDLWKLSLDDEEDFSDEVRVDCPDCGKRLEHNPDHPKLYSDGCVHWYCDECQIANWPEDREMWDICPICEG